MNIKVVVRLIQGEKVGAFAHATILTADDGTTAIEQLRSEMSAGRQVDFVLTDFVMVLEKFQVVIIAPSHHKTVFLYRLHCMGRRPSE
jgi:hypothetical protein